MEIRWTRPVKLLLVNHEYPPVGAGAATATHAMAHALSALGHEVAVLTSSYGDLPASSVEGPVAVKRIRCVRRRADRSNLFEMLTFVLSALFSLRSTLRTHQPNALIIFFSLPSGPVGVVAKLFFGLPYVVSLRGGDVSGLVPELELIHKTLAPLRRFVLKHALAIVANSEGLRELAEAADKYPVQVVPNGVDTEFFQPAGPEVLSPASVLRILFVGRFQEQKNLNVLFTQLAQLPRGAFQLHLVGDGPEKQRLRELGEQLGIAGAIQWHGWLPRDDLPAIYQSVDCLVNPSFYEGLPNVVLEAMACRLPVIASNVPGNADLVLDGETGFLFELEKPETLLLALKTLMTNQKLRHEMGFAGSRRAVAEFSWRSVATGYVQLFSRQ